MAKPACWRVSLTKGHVSGTITKRRSELLPRLRVSCLAALCGLRLRFPVLLSSSWCCSSLGCLSGGCCRCGTSPQSHIPLYMVITVFSGVRTPDFPAKAFIRPETRGETHFDFFHFVPKSAVGKPRFFPCRHACGSRRRPRRRSVSLFPRAHTRLGGLFFLLPSLL